MTHKHHSRHKRSSKRPHFTPKQLLTSDQLNQAQAFQMTNLQRALHALAGSGVVYGFKLSCDLNKHGNDKSEQPKKGSIFLGCGLAIDAHGRQLNWPGDWIDVNDIVKNKPKASGKYTLSVHYAERRINRQRNADECGGCDSDDEHILWIDSSVVFTLTECCSKKPNDCLNTQEKCLDVNGYVCEQLGQVPCYEEPKELCPTDCDNVYYDPENGIPLACVHVEDFAQNPEHCGSHFGFCVHNNKPEICDYRPYVYRNSLLYNLIRGDHHNYARVESLSWQKWILYNRDWDAPIFWKEFKDRVHDRDDRSEGFTITFSRPILTKTLHPGSIILSTVVQEARTDYWEERRIPLKKVRPMDLTEEGQQYTRKVKLEFEDNWLVSEIDDLRSTLEYGMIVELTIRGALLRDECGCMLNARPLGYEKSEQSCCQSLPGGDFIALFRVEPNVVKKTSEYKKAATESAE